MDDIFVGDNKLLKMIEEVDTMFPLYTPKPDDTHAKIMYMAGQRSVVEYIKSLVED